VAPFLLRPTIVRVRGHVWLGIGQAAGAVALAVAAGPALAAEILAIRHQPVQCLVAGKYPRLDACFEPPSRVARARVYFRGGGTSAWYYVEMKAEAPCFRGTLPRPKKSLKRIDYYVAVTDQDFAEARTEEYTTEVVPDEKSCAAGGVAPFVTTASVVVGGATALPAGFVGGGVLAGVSSTAAVVGAAAVGAGAAGVVIAGGGEETPPATTLPSSSTTTTTTTATPTTTTATTTTTTLPTGCATDSAPPEVQIQSPADGADVGAVVDITVEARDPGPVTSGIREVRVHAEEQGGTRTAAIATLPGPGPIFQASWTLPACIGPQDRWYVFAEAVDGCDRARQATVRVKRRLDSCSATTSAMTSTAPRTALVWSSELGLPGGRGQVIANGADVAFPGARRSELALPARHGRNWLEAVLVEGSGPGTWRFTLASGAIRAGSLRVLAGDVVAVGAETVAFRLRGRAGERLVFVFDAEDPAGGGSFADRPD
jgi:hypothetical protein